MGERTDEDCEALEFSAAAIVEIHERLRVELPQPFVDELNRIFHRFRPIVLSVPTHSQLGPDHLDVSKQAQWVQNSIINSAEQLRNALANEAHKFRGVMSPNIDKLIDIETYIPMLDKLIDEADMAYVELDQQATLGIRNTEQLQFEIVNALWFAFSNHLGDSFHARGQKNADQTIRIAFAEVYGKGESLASLLKTIRNSS